MSNVDDESALADPTVRVWIIPMNHAPCDSLELSWSWLDHEERRYADRFYFDRDRAQYIAAHAWLRRIVGEANEQHPGTVRFRRGTRGKPALSDANANGVPLFFNLSHTRGCIAIAVSNQCEVGVDVERIRPIAQIERAMKSVLSEPESQRLRALRNGQREELFFQLWAVKESYTKALGVGLYHPFDSLCAEIEAEGSARLDHLDRACDMPVASIYANLIRPLETDAQLQHRYAYSVSALCRSAFFDIRLIT